MSTDTPRKWSNSTTDPAGPIMVKRVNKAISDLTWEGKTFHTARKGFFGDPVDPDDLVFAVTAIVLGRDKGPLRTDAAAHAIGEQFDWTVTKKNYKLVIEAFETATQQAASERPVRDERPTREERIKRDIESERRSSEELAERETRDRLLAEALALRPDNAEALIIAVEKEDCSDIMSDYSANRALRTIAIGWRTGKREDFKQLHRAAASFPETAHLGSQAALDAWAAEKYPGRNSLYTTNKAGERRDNYSMGQGNYLSDHGWDGAGSGWIVRSVTLPANYLALTEIALGERVGR